MFAEACREKDWLAAVCRRRIWPKAGEPGWKALPEEKKQEILRWGREAMEAGYPQLLATQFMRFARDGNRKAWENPYFARRKALMGAAFAECIVHDAAQLDFIIDGLWLICEETTWILSAHNNKGNPGDALELLPEKTNPYIDLFAAQTADTVSAVCWLLGDRLNNLTPRICRRVMHELQERIFTPFMHQDDFWWMGQTRKELNNWTPWILSNILKAAQYAIKDDLYLRELVTKCCQILDRYLACLPEDGGCDEGTAYWNMAGGSLLDCLESLRELSGGKLDFYDVPKIREFGLFPLRSHVAGPWYWNFADCDARPILDGERVYTFSRRIGSKELMQLGCFIGARLMPRDTPQANRVLHALFTKMEPGTDPGPRDRVDLPDLQVYARTSGKMYTVIKGGHNGESHNHNDIGTFIIYVEGNPVIVDAGNMVYTRKTFSEERYTLWNTRSMYHNVPLIGKNGEQHVGESYRASDVRMEGDTLTMHLEKAYPDALGVRKLLRTACFRDGFSLTDEIELENARPVTWVFMTYAKPEIEETAIRIGPLCLTGAERLRAAVEEIPVTDARMALNFPGTLWRLTLTAEPAAAHHAAFRFTLS